MWWCRDRHLQCPERLASDQSSLLSSSIRTVVTPPVRMFSSTFLERREGGHAKCIGISQGSLGMRIGTCWPGNEVRYLVAWVWGQVFAGLGMRVRYSLAWVWGQARKCLISYPGQQVTVSAWVWGQTLAGQGGRHNRQGTWLAGLGMRSGTQWPRYEVRHLASVWGQALSDLGMRLGTF